MAFESGSGSLEAADVGGGEGGAVRLEGPRVTDPAVEWAWSGNAPSCSWEAEPEPL